MSSEIINAIKTCAQIVMCWASLPVMPVSGNSMSAARIIDILVPSHLVHRLGVVEGDMPVGRSNVRNMREYEVRRSRSWY